MIYAIRRLLRLDWNTWMVMELTSSLWLLSYNYRGTWYREGEYSRRKDAHEALLERVL